MKQKEVIAELKEMIVNQLERVHDLNDLPAERLQTPPSEKSWNVYQCLEHLNLYAEFYLESIEDRIQNSKASMSADQNFNPGYWGQKFCQGMLPNSEGKLNKMKTFKSKDPSKEEANEESLLQFINHQEQWLKLLEKAGYFDLNRNKCKLTIPLIRMNLGSTLRFVIFHQERHLLQAERSVG